MPPQVDYDKLAAQHGGTATDYDALATEAGGTTAASPEMNFAFVNGKKVPVEVESRLERAVGAGPMVGSTVGAIAGGVPGAIIGGAAGRGYQDLIEHAKEIPGAVVDVAKGLVNNPRETLGGFAEGAESGAIDSGLAGAVGGALEYGGNLAMKGLQNAAGAVYRGYLKPSLAAVNVKKAQQIVQTALEEAIPLTNKGIAKASSTISELNAEVQRILAARQNISQTVHGDIDLHDIAEKVRSFARGKYFKPGTPSEDFDAAMKVADNIDKHASLGLPPGAQPGPTPVDLTTANEVKTSLRDSAGKNAFGVERSAAQEAEKQGARNLRMDIETRAPAVGPLNARESKLLDTVKAIRQAVERDANQNPLYGVKSIIAAGAGGAEYGKSGDPWTAAATALGTRYMLRPEMVSKMAILAYRIGKLPGVAPASAARLALAALSEGQRDEK